MSTDPTAPGAPTPARRGRTPGRSNPRSLVLLGGAVVLLVVILAVMSLTGGSQPPPRKTPGPSATVRGTVQAGAPLTGTLAARITGTVAVTPAAATPTGPAAVTPSAAAENPSATPLPVGEKATPTLPAAQPSAPAGAVRSGTPTDVSSEPGTPAVEPLRVEVVESLGSSFACARSRDCDLEAAPGLPVYPGGEARTEAGGRLRLQTPAGLLALAGQSTLHVTALDDAQVALTLVRGRLLARAAAGRQGTLAITAGDATASGAGGTFGVALLSDGSVRVSAPADSARAVHVHSAAAGSKDLDLAPGTQVTIAATGGPGSPAPLDRDEGAALAALGDLAPIGTPAAVAAVTVVAVPSLIPFPSDVVTATAVLTPPAEGTLPPLTVLPVGQPTSTAGPETPIPTLAPPTATATPSGPAALLAAAVPAMAALPSYTFGATRGIDIPTAEFSAGTYAGDTACWTATTEGRQSDYQVRSGVVFRRDAGGAWQQQTDQAGIPAWLSYWQLLDQVDPATAGDRGPAPDDPDSHLLRARLLPTAGFSADTWVEATVGNGDYLVRTLVLSDGNPDTGRAFFRMRLSSLGDAAPCPPLTSGE